MTKQRKRWLAIVLTALNACGDDPDPVSLPTTPSPPSGAALGTLMGTIDGVRQLSADTTYTLQGLVTVAAGGELRVAAGATVLGSTAITPTALIVEQGGKIFSQGTAEAPVVFTSASEPGARGRGNWGGIAVFGRAPCNSDTQPCVDPDLGHFFGGDSAMDSSGAITYTRIEFCGDEIIFGEPADCMRLSGVGAGTQLHHIQVHEGEGDGFEINGGTFDLKYAVATGITDDAFDYDLGWSGRGQFWITQQEPATSDWAYQADNNDLDFDAEPRTEPTIYNATLVGGGMLMRFGVGGRLLNHIVTVTGEPVLDIDDPETAERLEIRNSIVHGTFEDEGDGIDAGAFAMTEGWNNQVVDPGLVDPHSTSAPDFRPAAGSPARAAGTEPPADDFFTPVDYIGAAAPDGDEWYRGWTSFERR
ncbi:MAG: hypothetical protein F4X36_20180 [Gammaproteobacteria bacterium]|nr:hypothetical protein [Gammaproteobacteria bacterium]